MDYYQEASLEDLPIEIQNMMILADQGIGFLHRYWGAKQQGNSVVELSDELET